MCCGRGDNRPEAVWTRGSSSGRRAAPSEAPTSRRHPRPEPPLPKGSLAVGYALRRSRLAFDRARLANGASIAAGPFPPINALAAVCVAATFSTTIR